MPKPADSSNVNEKSIKDMSPVEYFWHQKQLHDQKQNEESKTKTKGKIKKVKKEDKKAEEIPKSNMKFLAGGMMAKKQEEKQLVNNELPQDLNKLENEKKETKPQYVIPFEEPKPVKKKKGKKGEKDDKPEKGIHLIKDKEALTIKMPKYEEYQKPAERPDKPKPAAKGTKKKGVKKAPINVGSTKPF